MIKCPHCAENKRIFYKAHWDNSYTDFACGNCSLEIKLPIKMNNPQETLNHIFYHDFMEEIELKVNNMNQKELMSRFEELDKNSKRDN